MQIQESGGNFCWPEMSEKNYFGCSYKRGEGERGSEAALQTIPYGPPVLLWLLLLLCHQRSAACSPSPYAHPPQDKHLSVGVKSAHRTRKATSGIRTTVNYHTCPLIGLTRFFHLIPALTMASDKQSQSNQVNKAAISII